MLGLVRDTGLAWVGPVVTEGLEDVVAGDGGAGLRAERVDAAAVAAVVAHDALEPVGGHVVVPHRAALATP